MTRTRAPVVAAAATGLMALAACGREAGTAVPVPATGAGTGGAVDARLVVTEAGVLGPVVTDQHGLTLYRFDRDRASPPAATCAADCARLWPPMIVRTASEVVLSGIEPGLVGVVSRADGRTQVTLKGWPLYHFAEDVRPGDTNGQGVGGTWFAARPDGEKAQTTVAAPPPDSGGR